MLGIQVRGVWIRIEVLMVCEFLNIILIMNLMHIIIRTVILDDVYYPVFYLEAYRFLL